MEHSTIKPTVKHNVCAAGITVLYILGTLILYDIITELQTRFNNPKLRN